MAMARDGLLPPFFCDINKHTLVPVKGTIITGLAAAVLAFSMEVSDLAGMVSPLYVIDNGTYHERACSHYINE
jgi:solute carrier family 7 (cationic amino acid transporter), member 1